MDGVSGYAAAREGYVYDPGPNGPFCYGTSTGASRSPNSIAGTRLMKSSCRAGFILLRSRTETSKTVFFSTGEGEYFALRVMIALYCRVQGALRGERFDVSLIIIEHNWEECA